MRRPLVCFGYETALRIMREVRADEFVVVRGGSERLPDRPPKKSELKAIVERMEQEHPRLRLNTPVHVIVRGSSRSGASEACKPHACTVPLSGASFCRVGDAYVALPPLAVVQEAARGRGMVSLLGLLWEVCGSYQTERTASYSAYQVKPLASARVIGEYVARNSSTNGAQKVARLLRYLADDSASPRETKQALVFCLPMRYGGYGISVPCMNLKVVANHGARAISGRASFRCDLCWPNAKLDVEYQSRESHEGENSRISDSRRANALASMGWTVLGVTNDELDSLVATDTIARSICTHLGKRYQVSTPDHHARKLRLRRQLGLPVGHECEAGCFAV